MASTPIPCEKITVGVPVHNGAEFLERCLRSLAEQDYKHFQVIIFENASTDASKEIAESFCAADERFQLRPSDALLPAEDNFARAIRFCSENSELFCLRAYDDYTNETFLSDLAAALIADRSKKLAVPTVVQQKNGESNTIKVDEAITSVEQFLQDCKWSAHWSFPGSWYYGLFRGEQAAEYLITLPQKLGGAWATDRFAIMRFMLDDAVVVCNSAIFYCHITSSSVEKYTHKQAQSRLSFRLRYFVGLLGFWPTQARLRLIRKIKLIRILWKTAREHTHYHFRNIIWGVKAS